jgi:hypothetical protein
LTRLAPARATAAVAATLALLLVAGAAASRPLGGGNRAATVPLEPVLVVVGAGLVLGTAYAINALGGVRELASPGGGAGRRPGPLARAVAILVPVLLISIFAAAGARWHLPRLPHHASASRERHRAGQPGNEPASQRGAHDLAALAAGIALGIAGLGLVALRRARPPADRLREPRATVAAGVREALAAVALPADPRAAVLAAYARMESALADAGLARRDSEAPREYLARLEGALGTVRAPAVRLTALFERARFSTHPIGEDGRREAVDALGLLRAELERPA